MEKKTETAEVWAVVDLFGHTRVAGRISDHVIGGETFIRIDVPANGDQPEFTELYGKGAIYSIKFVAEDIARGIAKGLERKPISLYDLPAEMRQRLTALPAPTSVRNDDPMGFDDDRDDDDEDYP